MPLTKYLKKKASPNPPEKKDSFQNLPPSEYPRSYTPKFEAHLRSAGSRSSSGGSEFYSDAFAGPNAKAAAESRDQNVQAGERVTFGKRIGKKKDDEE